MDNGLDAQDCARCQDLRAAAVRSCVLRCALVTVRVTLFLPRVGGGAGTSRSPSCPPRGGTTPNIRGLGDQTNKGSLHGGLEREKKKIYIIVIYIYIYI